VSTITELVLQDFIDLQNMILMKARQADKLRKAIIKVINAQSGARIF